MKLGYALLFFLLYGKATSFAVAVTRPDQPNNKRVVVVTLDGLRWQEVFGGADSVLLQQAISDSNNADLLRFAGVDPQIRRYRLMPFLWQVVARHGQLVGNRTRGSKMNVTNPYALSFAGYNELFTGRPDLRIWSNEKKLNSNHTILEYLNRMNPFRGRVASVASWDAFPFIFNEKRSRIKVAVGRKEGRSEVRPDTATFAAARSYILKHRPRVLHLGLGGTDEAGHQKSYANYLRQAHLADQIIAALWHLLQQLPEYRDNTALVITTDHGRGRSRHTWHKHGFFVPGSSETWLAVMGNGFGAMGESCREEQLFSGQVAGTIGYLLQVHSFRAHTIPLNRLSAP